MPSPRAYCLSFLTTQINQVFRTVCLSGHCHHLETLSPAETYHHDSPASIAGLLCCPRHHTSCSLQTKPVLLTESTFLTFLPTMPQFMFLGSVSCSINRCFPSYPGEMTALLNPCSGGSASLMQEFAMSPRWTFE